MKYLKHILAVFTLTFLFPAFLIAQEKELEVTYTFKRGYVECSGKKGAKLIKKEGREYKVKTYSYGTVSIRETDPLVISKTVEDMRMGIYDTMYNYVRVDYKKGELHEPVKGNMPGEYKMLLVEKLPLFNWIAHNETKTILGYTCVKATTSFRGREYIAWFTRELPFKAAPWKIHGLPGVVLETQTTDAYLKWIVESVQIKGHVADFKLPYHGLEHIGIEKYINFLKDKKRTIIENNKKNKARHLGKGLSYKEIEMNQMEIFDLD